MFTRGLHELYPFSIEPCIEGMCGVFISVMIGGVFLCIEYSVVMGRGFFMYRIYSVMMGGVIFMYRIYSVVIGVFSLCIEYTVL